MSRRKGLQDSRSEPGADLITRLINLFRHDPARPVNPGFRIRRSHLGTPPQSTLTWSLELIRSLEWKRFEDLCGLYFEAKGYVVKNTGLGADGGADFLLYLKGKESTKPFGIIQCKAWNRWKVGVRPIRELFGVMADVGAEIGVFATSSEYTNEAERFASNKHIQLLNGERLLKLITTMLDATQQTELLTRITTGDYSTPSCPNCGTKLVLRETARPFWGCRNFPRCRYTLNARWGQV